MIRWPMALALAILAFGVSAASPTDVLHDLPNVSFPAPNRIASGRLQPRDLPALQAAGVRVVIDLSVDSETPDFDEAAAMQGAGIAYHALPIRGAGELNAANVARFDRLLAHAGSARTLVHCASSNRVGAMIALRAATLQGQSVETALAEGRRWGLKGLGREVRERLANWPASPAAAAPATTR